MAKPKYDPETIRKLLRVLIENPEGLWLSRLAKMAGVPKSTTAYYLNNQLRPLIDENTLGDEKRLIRIVSLKPIVIEELNKGRSLDKIMRIIKIMKEYEGL
jgi:hypothetical protein